MQWGSCCSIFRFLSSVLFVDHCLSLCLLFFLRFTASDYPFGIFKSLLTCIAKLFFFFFLSIIDFMPICFRRHFHQFSITWQSSCRFLEHELTTFSCDVWYFKSKFIVVFFKQFIIMALAKDITLPVLIQNIFCLIFIGKECRRYYRKTNKETLPTHPTPKINIIIWYHKRFNSLLLQLGNLLYQIVDIQIFQIIWLSSILALAVPGGGRGYFGNASCALGLISTF